MLPAVQRLHEEARELGRAQQAGRRTGVEVRHGQVVAGTRTVQTAQQPSLDPHGRQSRVRLVERLGRPAQLLRPLGLVEVRALARDGVAHRRAQRGPGRARDRR